MKTKLIKYSTVHGKHVKPYKTEFFTFHGMKWIEKVVALLILKEENKSRLSDYKQALDLERFHYL